LEHGHSTAVATLAADDPLDRSELFRALVQTGSHAVVDRDAVISYISPSITLLSGYTPEELVGKVGFDFVAPESLQSAGEYFARIRDEGPA
jgi:PAS domain S-box-containing protein